MRCKDIRFAKEISFNVEVPDMEGKLQEETLYEYQVTYDDFFVLVGDDFYRFEIIREEESVLENLNFYKDKSLLRLDKVSGKRAVFTLLAFSQSEIFTEEEALHIVIDQALEPDLRRNNIDSKNAIKEIKKQVLVDGKYCFSYGRGIDSESIELLGQRWSFVLAKTPQNYLHIIEMRPRNNKTVVENSVVLLQGNIVITDELSNRDVITRRVQEQYNNLLRDNAEFIKLWDIYDELEMESIRQEASEMGYLQYKSYKYLAGNLIFDLLGYADEKFVVNNMYYVAISKQMFNAQNPLDYNERAAVVIGTEVDKTCINTPTFVIKEEMDTARIIPESGYLLPSLSGSIIQRKRRMIARSKISSEKCEMSGLKNIIQAGSLVGVQGRHRNPVSSDLEKKILGSKGYHFTEKQKQAIDIAINTPDIAVIQGPPGTGKTTVIRSIVERIDELENSKAKILIASTQHDAVDNAVENISYGGVPVNRVSIRRRKEQDTLPIYQWIDDMVDSCEKWLLSNENDNQRSAVRDIFGRIVHIKETASWEERLEELLKVQEQMSTFVMNTELLFALNKLISSIKSKVSTKDNVATDDELICLLREQRTSKVAYLDDGVAQLKQLESYLLCENDKFEYDIPAYWKKLKRNVSDTPELDEYLAMFQEDIKQLEKLAGVDSLRVDDKLLEMDMSKVLLGIQTELLALGESKKQSLTNVIWEFTQELTNSYNVAKMIEAYSKINAATCQQSANPFISSAMKGFEDSYAYVIIDEAARSNPLDLLIPMSMGKKVILVGDHKQLPHMVEKDVVEAVIKKTNKMDANSVLEESLFMRLFNLILKEDERTGITRTAMLTEQYRMHEDICGIVNLFYDGKLETKCSREEKEHNLEMYNNKALVWLDMPISDDNPIENKGISKSRDCEVERIKEELAKILAKSKYKIGIITFYSEQAGLIRKMVQKEFPGEIHRIEVGTVDAFQGKEFDVVILSTVRSNTYEDIRQRVGFLNNNNRLCVAFSRAKRLLITIGDSATVAKNGDEVYIEALAELLTACKNGGGYYE